MRLPPRLIRELKTISVMVEIYCRDHHPSEKAAVCDDCAALLKYAQKRLSRCPFQENKPICGTCTIHCYTKNMQAGVREIMRYSGPKMLWNHPVLAILHVLDGRKKNRIDNTSSIREKKHNRA